MPDLTLALTGLLLRLVAVTAHRHDGSRDRGDVPGWVLITIMTAGLVTAIWVVAKDQLTTILQTALNSVKTPA